MGVRVRACALLQLLPTRFEAQPQQHSVHEEEADEARQVGQGNEEERELQPYPRHLGLVGSHCLPAQTVENNVEGLWMGFVLGVVVWY